jgi:hypothetical protein
LTSEAVAHERDDAKTDALDTCQERGVTATFRLRDEAQVSRDRYGSIKGDSSSQLVEVPVYPLEMQPDRNRLQRAGLFQAAQAIAWTPSKAWEDAGVAWGDIDLRRATVEVAGQAWSLTEKGRASQFADSFLYWTFGLERK